MSQNLQCSSGSSEDIVQTNNRKQPQSFLGMRTLMLPSDWQNLLMIVKALISIEVTVLIFGNL